MAGTAFHDLVRSDSLLAMPRGVPDLSAYLRGDWQVTRRLVADKKTPGKAYGKAQFILAAGGLCYRENVRIAVGDFSGHASRSYFYQLTRRYLAEVLFDDGRPFHALDLRAGRCRVEHQCGNDLYCGIFRVLGPSSWSVRWRVRGPRKNARIFTLYRRLGCQRC